MRNWRRNSPIFYRNWQWSRVIWIRQTWAYPNKIETDCSTRMLSFMVQRLYDLIKNFAAWQTSTFRPRSKYCCSQKKCRIL